MTVLQYGLGGVINSGLLRGFGDLRPLAEINPVDGSLEWRLIEERMHAAVQGRVHWTSRGTLHWKVTKMANSSASEIPTIYLGETRNGKIDFTEALDSGELLTGTPTITVAPEGPTISNPSVNAEALIIHGEPVAAGRAVAFTIAGHEAGKQYELTVTVGTTATPAQLFKRKVLLRVPA